MILIALLFTFLFLIPMIQSGATMPICPACSAVCIIPFNPLCITCVASLCVVVPMATACFDENTKIAKYENGQIKDANIYELKKNDIVLANNLNKFTKVVRNVKSEGTFNYTQITLESGKTLTVTNEHGVIIMDHESNQKIMKASDLKEGQMLITMKGTEIIKNVKYLSIKDKYILETEDGTVIANGVYVSTICDDMINEKINADDLIKHWKAKHSILYNKIINN